MIKRKETLPTPPITLDVYNQEGVVVSKKELPGDIFNFPIKEELVHFVLIAQQARARAGTASTKTRGEVRGGGKKPWKQKGTGRARHGSIRSPLWRGGGIVFGPRPTRNWAVRINKKVRKQALRMVLSSHAMDGSLLVLDALALAAPKTKEAVRLFSRLPLQKRGSAPARVGVILPPRTPVLARAMRNIPYVRVLSSHRLTVADLLKCRTLIAPIKSLDEMIYLFEEKKTPHSAKQK